MKISDALVDVEQLYIEAAPFIYYVEDHADYADKMTQVFYGVNEGSFEAVTSVITLTEVLTKPLKAGDHPVEQAYRTLLQSARHVTLLPISAPVADLAARLRSQYNLRTPDALHVASAIDAGCGALMTNDLALRRITEIRVLILDELELDSPTDER